MEEPNAPVKYWLRRFGQAVNKRLDDADEAPVLRGANAPVRVTPEEDVADTPGEFAGETQRLEDSGSGDQDDLAAPAV